MPGKLVMQTLTQAWNALEPLQLPMAVMGGVALSAWKYVRATQDVDLLLSLGAESMDVALETLGRAGFRGKRHPPVTVVGPARFLQLIYEPSGSYCDLELDILLAESEFEREVIARRLPFRMEGMDRDAFVIRCEDLILFKLAAGRIRDLLDVTELLKANRSDLDLSWLGKWIPRLKVATEWAQAWGSAFPDQPIPYSS